MGEAADQIETGPKESLTVLLVEDDVLVRLTTADFLRAKGYNVIEAGTVIEAATVLSASTRVHVVFSDVDLPGATGGLSLAVWVHAHFPSIPVILTSGVRSIMPALSTQRTVPFLSKPYDLDTASNLIADTIVQATLPTADKST